MELFLFLGSLFFFLAFGIPIAMVLVLCAMVLMFHADMWDSMTIASCMLDGANNYPLMAIPFFVFAGEIMAAGGLSKRVVQFAQLLIGGVRGGLGYAAIVASILFAGLMGSSVGEAAALGGLLLKLQKYASLKIKELHYFFYDCSKCFIFTICKEQICKVFTCKSSFY